MGKVIVMFTEGETDEEFYKAIINNIRGKISSKRFDVDAIEYKCIRGISKFGSKLLNKFQKEIVPKYSNNDIIVFLCYDTDAFENSQHPPVDRKRLQQQLLQSGAKKVVHLKAARNIEDFFIQDIDGIFNFLRLNKNKINIKNRNDSGLELIKYLFRCANRTYQKGYKLEGFINSLNINLISSKICIQLRSLCNELGLNCSGNKCN
jgi:hypothetical protein